ncbi:MAG TPA: DUF3592 domain-containing protein [Bacteroidia bacterium]|jgi:hypothetical protein|nr:DUF3592 domain-containing protein [Bacteroidia bacterium]
MKTQDIKYFYYFILVFFILVFVGVIFETCRIILIFHNSSEVKGTVISIEILTGPDPGRTKTYSINYTVNENKYTVTNYVQLDDNRYKIGDVVNVIYNNKNPENAWIDSWIETYYGITLYLVIDIILLLPIFLLKRYLKSKIFNPIHSAPLDL